MQVSNKKLLVICGPTATGKTKLAFDLAKKFNGVPISADSRQVYKYMNIGTGKEGKMLGYDLVNPNEEFSVSYYLKFIENAIREIIEQKKLPILVGGTGLYIKAVVDGIETVNIPPYKSLREKLKNKNTNQLFEMLKKTNAKKANSMNESDRKNPRRLIRAIEISSQISQYPNIPISKSYYDALWIGHVCPLEELKRKINTRVDKRVKQGFEKEIKFLKENGYWNGAPSVTLGYKDWPDIDRWKKEEFGYAKRQMVWFKKEKRINWFDITNKNWQKEVENLVQKWYAQDNAKKS